MAGDTTITVIGNLTDDPELRFTPSGAAVAKFRIASTPRILDKASGEWKDGEPLFLSCTVWRQVAENVAESLQRGSRVIVSGRLRSGRTRRRKARSAPSSSWKSTRSARRCATRQRRCRGCRVPAAAASVRPVATGGGGGFASDDPWATAAPALPPRRWGQLRRRATVLSTSGVRDMAKAAALRKPKKKVNPLDKEGIAYIDYKDVALLRKFISDRGKIRARRVTGVSSQQQRQIASAVKNAREMALLPYTTTAR